MARRLNKDQVVAVRNRFSSGETVNALAQEFDVAPITLYNALIGETKDGVKRPRPLKLKAMYIHPLPPMIYLEVRVRENLGEKAVDIGRKLCPNMHPDEFLHALKLKQNRLGGVRDSKIQAESQKIAARRKRGTKDLSNFHRKRVLKARTAAGELEVALRHLHMALGTAL